MAEWKQAAPSAATLEIGPRGMRALDEVRGAEALRTLLPQLQTSGDTEAGRAAASDGRLLSRERVRASPSVAIAWMRSRGMRALKRARFTTRLRFLARHTSITCVCVLVDGVVWWSMPAVWTVSRWE